MTNQLKRQKEHSLQDGVILLSTGCDLLWYNDVFEKIFGPPVSGKMKFCPSRSCWDSSCTCEVCSKISSGAEGKGVFLNGQETIGNDVYRVIFSVEKKGAESVVKGSYRKIFTDKSDMSDRREGISYLNMALERDMIRTWEFDLESCSGSREEISELIDRVLDRINEDDRENAEKNLLEVADGIRKEVRFDYRLLSRKGKWKWFRALAFARIREGESRPFAIGGISRNIDDMKRAEAENIKSAVKLQESEKRLKNAMKLGRMSPWEYDFQAGTFITDRQMSGIWGLADYYRRREPVTPEILSLNLHPDDREQALGIFRDAVDKQHGFDIQFRIRVDEKTRYIHFVGEVEPESDKGSSKLKGLAQDITDLKSMEEDLLRQYEGLKMLADRFGIGLWELDVDGGKLSQTKRDENTLTGSVYKNSTFSDFLSRIHPEDVDHFMSKYEKYVRGGSEDEEIEIRLWSDEGLYKWFYISAVISGLNDSSVPVAMKGLYQDISDRKDIENRLYQSQKMEAVGRLAGGVAHDFNNMLQVILGFSSLALLSVDSESEIFEYISNIVDSGERARGLVRQLLLFARKEKFKPTLVSVNDLISGITKMLERVIGEDIVLDFRPGEELEKIYADQSQIEQVIMNLCLNSRDAIEDSGRIIVRTENLIFENSWNSYDNEIPPGRYIMISVSDDGLGFSHENLGKIFEPFFTTKDKSQGTGLGLATVYSIVKQHSGYVDVYSIENRGTTFRIYFPVSYNREYEAKEHQQDEPHEEIMHGMGAVLLAEDDDLIRKYASRILMDAGFEVYETENGEEAVKVYREKKDSIRLLLFDVMMPRKNGWDAYMEIAGPGMNVPVIFFSGYDENLLLPELEENKPVRYLQKPFKYFSMINLVNEMISRPVR